MISNIPLKYLKFKANSQLWFDFAYFNDFEEKRDPEMRLMITIPDLLLAFIISLLYTITAKDEARF
jgi:hypothetical protein